MKKLLSTLILTASTLASATSGGMGNGGHPFEMQFLRAGRQVVKILKDDQVFKAPAIAGINTYLLELNLETIKIEVKNKRKGLRDKFGKKKCALNFPGKKLIQLDENCWKDINSKVHLKLPFVLHELLGLSGEEVDHYNISSKLGKSVESFVDSLYSKVELNSVEGSEITSEYSAVREIGEFSQENLSFYFDFDKAFGLREYQYKTLDTLCQNLGFRFHVKAKSRISNYLIHTLETKDGGLALSESENVDKYIKSVTCAK
jgi:hypothetical protein